MKKLFVKLGGLFANLIGSTIGVVLLVLVVFSISITELTVQEFGDQPMEYVDNQYQFAFQFPRDWKLDTKPLIGDAGERRVVARHPTKPFYVQALVTGPGIPILTKEKYDTAPNRDAVVTAMIQFTIDEVYKKTSRQVGAERMIVVENKIIPSNTGIQFYISTLHMVGPKGDIPMLIAGNHKIPFGKPYMVTFIMVSPVDKAAVKENELITKVFNSFHIIGETPIQ